MKKAFSLIELLISLIIISLITAAFAPVITAKFKNREIALSGSKVGTDCSKFSEKCMICSNEGCMLCGNSCPIGQYCDEADNCICKSCSAKFSYCAKCTKNYCEVCNEGYKAVNGKCQKITCPSGYYLSGISCLPCSSPCKTCTNALNCTGCIDGYTLDNGSCKENKLDADCYKVDFSKICIAKFNAGDPGGLEIPDGLVTMKTTVASGATGGTHSREICWRGENNGGCDAAYGGYSGCSRTVCTRTAGKKICEYHGWRLPTPDELASFLAYSKDKGASGLQLCDKFSGYSSALCMSAARCPDAHAGACGAHAVWSSKGVKSYTGYCYRLNKGVFSKVESDNSFAYSVRCVKDL